MYLTIYRRRSVSKVAVDLMMVEHYVEYVSDSSSNSKFTHKHNSASVDSCDTGKCSLIPATLIRH